MSALINTRELQRQIELEGLARTSNALCEALADGELRPSDFSLAETYQAIFGYEQFNALHPKYHGATPAMPGWDRRTQVYSDSAFNSAGELTEANRGAAGGQAFGGAVNSAAFANITGQIVYNTLLEAYKMDDLIGESLVTNVPTQFNGERIAGVGGVGDFLEKVREGDEYPTLSPNEQWIDTPQTDKEGAIVPLTREAIYFDRTGQLIEQCRAVAEYAAISKEKELLDVIFGVVNPYSRNGVATNTYLSSGAYVNQHTNVPADFTDIEAAENLLYGMLDPNTGEPMKVDANAIICEFSQRYTLQNILNARFVMRVDNQANATTYRTESPNPINNSIVAAGPYTMYTNRYCKTRLAAGSKSSHWFMGNPTKAFMYMENWPITSVQAAPNSHDEFHRDIVQQFKVSRRGKAAVRDPRYMVENTN